MRTIIRQQAVVSLTMVATLLLAGFSCPLVPGMPPQIEDVAVDAIANPDSDTANDAEDAGAITANPTIWIVGNPAGSFVHVQPGVKSEFYIDFQTGPGNIDLSGEDPNSPRPVVSIDMDGPGVIGTPVLTQPFKPNSSMRFIFPINSFGDYTATGDVLDQGKSVFHFEIEEEVK